MKILFVASGGKNNKLSPIIINQGESLKEIGINLEYFPVRGGIYGYLAGMIKLRKSINLFKPDIIHAHYGLCGIVSLFARKKQKLVVSFMGDDLLGSNKTNGSISKLSRILALINQFLMKKFYDASILKSSEMLKFVRDLPSTFLIPNGVNLKKFEPINSNDAFKFTGYDEAKKHIIFVSDPNRPEKNFRLASKAVELLKENSIQLHVVSGIENRNLVFYYNAASVLVLTSFHEGSPNVIKEALACNCPIVSTDVGDVKWLIGAMPGCYISSFEPRDVAEKIKKAISFSNQNGNTRGRERIIELGIDSKSIADKLCNVYSLLMN